jgi:uncharacterized alkaline shock family protein YloU
VQVTTGREDYEVNVGINIVYGSNVAIMAVKAKSHFAQLVKHYTMKTYGGVEVSLHFL